MPTYATRFGTEVPKQQRQGIARGTGLPQGRLRRLAQDGSLCHRGQEASACATRYQPIFSNGTGRWPKSRLPMPGTGAAQRTALVMTLRTFLSL